MGDAVVLDIVGDIDMTTAPEIAQAVDLVPEGTGRVVVDLSEVGFVDSTGLNALVSSRRVLEARDIVLRVVVPEGCAIRRVFEITQLTEPLHVVGERATALAESQPTTT